MNYKIILLSILLLSMVGISMAADFQAPMNGSDNTYYNVSYKSAAITSTPFSVWIFVAAAGFYLMIISFLTTSKQNSDIFAYLAVPTLGLATWQSMALDIVTGSGITSQAGKYVMMEQHTIYSITSLTIIFLILFIISILNVIRVVTISNSEVDENVYEDSPY